ncbi:MAG: hypothetical protein JW782_02135 [Candidatus Saganbacteria bacterium]|nr:hypothetical protein [Candidatus Saganbacteria bacterium]
MKKAIALFTVIAFAVALAGMASAQMDNRTPAEKLASGQQYLKTLDAKIIKYRKLGNAAVVKKLQADKKSTIARMKTWKAQMEAQEAAPPPPPPAPRPVAPAPPPPARPAARPAAPAPAGLFGMGLNTDFTVGYIAGNGVMFARGDLVLGDALGIGPMLGMSEDSVQWKLGLGAAMGKDINDNEKKALPLMIDGVLNIPADVMGGVESYIGGGVNYVLYGSEKLGGSYGGQVYYGVAGDIGLGGKSYAELAYTIIRSGADAGHTVPYSMKGIGVNFGTQIVL